MSDVDNHPREWFLSMRDKLYSMFCSPMKEDYTHEAFKWVSHLSISIGDLSWISPDGDWTTNEVKIFNCIARLSMTEISIILPLIQRHLTCGEIPDCEDGKVLARSANTDDYDRFGDHLVIIESIIKTLVKDQTEEKVNTLADAIKGEELKNLLERLKDTISLIVEYIELAHGRWNELVQDPSSEKFSSVEAGTRIICVWLSEDPCSFENQSERFLIDLIVKHLLLGGPSKHDLFILALHSVCTNNNRMLKTLRQCPNSSQALESYLNYVQTEQRKSADDRRAKKMFKLRCSLVKDLISERDDSLFVDT